jgi:hypothetical protein
MRFESQLSLHFVPFGERQFDLYLFFLQNHNIGPRTQRYILRGKLVNGGFDQKPFCTVSKEAIDLGSIPQNSLSAEIFSETIFILKFCSNFHQKTTDKIDMFFYGQYSWILCTLKQSKGIITNLNKPNFVFI